MTRRARPEPAGEEIADDAAALLALARSGAPLDAQREALAAFLRGRGASPAGVDAVLAGVRDGIVLLPEGPATSQSRLGGPAVLPAGTPWPAARGRPHSFVGAFDLGALPHLDPLPDGGTLLVYWDFNFYDDPDFMDFVEATTVHHVAAGAPTEHPALPEGAWQSERVALTGLAMPIPASAGFEAAPEADADALGDAAVDLMLVQPDFLLGASRDIQGPVLDEVPYWFAQGSPETRERYTEAERAGEGWALLAQIEHPALMPTGGLYLLAPGADLRSHRFDRVMGVFQD